MANAARPAAPDVDRFRWLALTASLITYLLIVVGAIVRVTGSGPGCGGHWPLCNGQFFPPLTSWPVFIALSHRILVALAAPLIFGTAWAAWRSFRRVRWIVWPALLALAQFAIQVLLGAATVATALSPAIVAIHLASALLALAFLLIVTVVAFQLKNDPRLGDSLLYFDAVSRQVGIAALGVYALIVTGALVTANRAGAACEGWPLCSGSLAPDTVSGLWHMGHRYASGVVGIMLAVSVAQAWRLRRENAPVVVAATVTGLSFGGQVVVGAQDVLHGLPAVLNGLHVALAAAVWAGMVVFAVLAMQYVRLSPLKFAVPASARAQPGWMAAFAAHFIKLRP
ncbi:MAG TPA: COX15/CtaA family protein [Anaerolineales bacterium]|nr:COX15/CtaA family protein [Anaerolineales bacterium]